MNKIEKQMDFLIEIDKMKSIIRQTLVITQKKNETDAEHSWHLAMMIMILEEYASEIDVCKTIKMALIHDLVEIYAGDVLAYNAEIKIKKAKEQKAKDQIFGILPKEQAIIYKDLFDEFDEAKTKEAKFANALDRLQPIINNYKTKGEMWQKNNVNPNKVLERIETIKEVSLPIWEYAFKIVNESIKKGYFNMNEESKE